MRTPKKASTKYIAKQLRIPVDDEDILAWIDLQQNFSASMRMLILQQIRTHGKRDYFTTFDFFDRMPEAEPSASSAPSGKTERNPVRKTAAPQRKKPKEAVFTEQTVLEDAMEQGEIEASLPCAAETVSVSEVKPSKRVRQTSSAEAPAKENGGSSRNRIKDPMQNPFAAMKGAKKSSEEQKPKNNSASAADRTGIKNKYDEMDELMDAD